MAGRPVGLLAALGLLLALLGLTTPGFLGPANLSDLALNSATLAVAAGGQTAVILAGEIDISVGSMLAVCAVLSGDLAKAGWPLPAVALAAVAAGAALGSVNGALTAWAGIPSIIVTLGTMSALRGALLWATQGNWVQNLPGSFTAFGTGSRLGVPIPVWVATGVLMALALLFSRTRFGRHLYAVGGNPRAAALAGLNVPRARILAFALNGGLVGLAALLYASRFVMIQSNAGVGFELTVITAVVVGGARITGGSGSLAGTVLGVALLAVLGSGITRHVSTYWEGTAQGSLILLSVLADRR